MVRTHPNKETIHCIPTYRLLESSLVCKESTSHRTSRVVGVRVGRNRANSTRSHGSWGGHKRIKCTRGGDSSVSIALKRCLGGSISTVAQSSAEKGRDVVWRQMGSEELSVRRTPSSWIKFRCHGRQFTQHHRDGREDDKNTVDAGRERGKEIGMVKKVNKTRSIGEGNRKLNNSPRGQGRLTTCSKP